ncbi:MAG: WYL domain-containing protein [Clostridia bacterium]|nr:WYL domain-containing protein [Clostridia bacterium]
MASNETKRMACLRIFHILKKHTRPSPSGKLSEAKMLTQAEISNLLEVEYNILLERKAISNYLGDLESSGIGVFKTTKGAYYDSCGKDLTEAELCLLIDLVLASRCIDTGSTRKIINKLCSLTSKHFKSEARNIHTLDTFDKSDNKDLFNTIAQLNEAMSQNLKVEFVRNDYGIDKALHPIERVVVSPYRLVMSHGHYYLIASNEREELNGYRVDKITSLCILASPRKRADEKIDDYIYSHPYMLSGEMLDITLAIDKDLIGEVIDAFGKNFRINGLRDSRIIIRTRASREDVLRWAIRFGHKATVIEPQEMRDQLRDFANSMQKNYEGDTPPKEKRSTK